MWSLSSGTGTITTASSPTSGVTGLVAGTAATFIWTISNGSCPVSEDSVVITVNQGATGSAGADASICETDTIILSGTIGGGATSSVWSKSGTGTFDDSTLLGATYTPSAADITAGSVTLTLTTDDPDGAGPCVSVSDAMVLTFLASPTAVISASTNVLCTGDLTGSATAAPTGGTGPYTYVWSDTLFQTTITAINLKAGLVGVMVMDANGCQDTANVIITEPALALAGATGSTNATCGVADGEAFVTASGGTGAYTYVWNDALAQTTDTAFNLLAGPYNVMITDSNACMVIVAATVSDAGAPTATISGIMDVTCFGANDGSAMVSATGGAGPYTYSWNTTPVQTTQTATGLPGGVHSATVEDSIGCASVVPVTINEPSAVAIASETKSDITCNGASDGRITVVASGGTGLLTYSIDGGLTYVSNSGAFIGLSAATYVISVQDSMGCTVAGGTHTIVEPSAVVISSETASNATCNGAGDGGITIVASGGTGPLSYSIDSGLTYTNTTGVFIGLATGMYGIAVMDANMCPATIGSTLTVGEPSVVTIDSVISVNISCNGGSDGTITITASGGTGTISYSINGGTTYPDTTGMFTGLAATTYNIAVKDANNCAVTGNTITITEPGPFTTFTNPTSSNCGQADGSATVLTTLGISPFTYIWNNGATTSTITGLLAGTYTVTVTDASGCTSTDVANVADLNTAGTTTSVVQDATCAGKCDGSASVAITGATPPYVYLW
ncbi:MAG: SprB repeat-containing protein, partial [Flavobacteriales bacterium]|nr:SprB repeat-containing protein [Flavobacteriales bacterium]